MNALVPQLPPGLEHLAHFYQANLPDLGNEASSGINTFAHHRVSIRGGKWRLVDAQGAEAPVASMMTNPATGQQQMVEQNWLDVIFVDANPFMSKTYYKGGYDSTTEDKAPPTCWSDNGIAPSDRVAEPQCGTCAACPMNVIGSKITDANKPTKACSDSKKLAIILADNPTGPVYELRVPPASLKNMANAFKTYTARGMRIETMVFRLTFEMEAEYPKIIFNVTNYITAEQAGVVQRLLGSPETAEIVSKNDKPKQVLLAAPQAPAPAIAAPVHTTQPTTPYAPQVVNQPVMAPAAPAPVAPAPVAFTPPTHAPAGIVGAVPVDQPTAAPKAPRKKKQPEAPAAPMQVVMPPQPVAVAPAAPAPVAAPQFMPPAVPVSAPVAVPAAVAPVGVPAFLQNTPQFAAPAAPAVDVPHAAPAAASVVTQAQPTNLELDNILNGMNL